MTASPIPLDSTVGYARFAREGKFGMRVIPRDQLRPGDWIGWSRNGNMDRSSGRDGHGMIVDHPLGGGRYATIESWGTHGPGFNTRGPEMVTIAVRIDWVTPAMVERMRELTRWCLGRGVRYYSGPGDNDHDGLADRADLNDHRSIPGVDCTGYNFDCWDFAVNGAPVGAVSIPAGPPPPRWHDWFNLSGEVRDAPAIASWAPNRLDVFARGVDGNLWHCWCEGLRWSAWENLGHPGAVLAGPPAVCSWGPGHLDVFVRGADGNLWHRWFDLGWHGWDNLGPVAGDPAAAAWGPGRIDLAVPGTDGTLRHRWWDRTWSGWENLGGTLASAPALSARQVNMLDAWVRGTDGALWHRWWNGQGWSAWERLGGTLRGAPAACSWHRDRADVFVRGQDSALWHRWWDGRWSDWESLGGQLTTAPAVDTWGPPRIDVVAGGADAAIWLKSFA